MRKKSQLQDKQSGLVSIVVTIMIMLIITLIVLAFARIARREQRQALDRQLSTQAFYAAETGINDAIAVLKTNPTATKTSCGADGPFTADPTLNSANGVSYTCLLVNNKQDSLEYSVGEPAAVAPLKSVDAAGTPTNMDHIYISWQGKDNTTLTGCSGLTLPLADSWPADCGAGLLRLDLVPVAASLDRTTLVNSTMTAFLFPSAPGAGSTTGTLNYVDAQGFGQQGRKYQVTCVASPTPPTHQCTMDITVPAGNQYQVRFQSLYKNSRVNIRATNGVAALKLIDAQATIDSTGKASDVLRRIQVRVPLSGPTGVTGDYAIQSADDLCKQFRVGASFFNATDGCSGP